MRKLREQVDNISSPEDIIALYKQTLSEAGFEVYRPFSHRFNRKGFVAIHRRPIGSSDSYDVTSAILVSVVKTRRKGTRRTPHVRIWRIDFETPSALQILNKYQLILPLIETVRIMPHTLIQWRKQRANRPWAPVLWWEIVHLSREEHAALRTYSDLYLRSRQ